MSEEEFINTLNYQINEYYSNTNNSIDYILRNYIDNPIKGNITKGKLRCRGIKNIVHDKNNLIGIIQRDHLITYDGYKIPYRNGHFHYEEKFKIKQL